MKKFLSLLTVMVLSSVLLMAQNTQRAVSNLAKAYSSAPVNKEKAARPNYWKTSLMTNLNFIQTSYMNWAKGGVNNVAMDAYVDANANYKKDSLYWNTRLQLDYGFLYSQDKPIIQKNKDRMLLESTLGHAINKSFSYTAKLIFLNQFSDGYNYLVPSSPKDPKNITRQEWLDARVLKSGFLSPADITLGLGADWNPNEWLKINFAPATGGLKIVTNPLLRKMYGMPALKTATDEELNSANPGKYYKSTRFQFGAMLTADANLQINDNFTAATQLILFSDYLNKPQNIRVNWTNRFMWKLAKYFSLNFQTDLVYDDAVLIVTEKYPQGRQMVQFLESFKFGFTYTFASKN